jgi:hypothetical protein
MAEILIIQYLRPHGREAIVRAYIPDELVELVGNLVISGEQVPTDKVIIYAHRKGESEEDELTELADNGPGENSPDIALERLIRRFKNKPFKPFTED